MYVEIERGSTPTTPISPTSPTQSNPSPTFELTSPTFPNHTGWVLLKLLEVTKVTWSYLNLLKLLEVTKVTWSTSVDPKSEPPRAKKVSLSVTRVEGINHEFS